MIAPLFGRRAMVFRRLVTLGLLANCIISAVNAAPPSMIGNMEERRSIGVNNRILAKIYGKAISVVDVQKKMDIVFYKRFPEYANSPTLRSQFYQINWRPMLNELIDKELILADAKENKVEISKGDVRQEIETIFGPNIMAGLHEVGIPFEEARDMLEGDLMIRRMMMMRVNMKAHRKVSPAEVRKAYQEYILTHKVPTEWTYQVISVRHPDPAKGLSTASLLKTLLSEAKITPEELAKSYHSLESVDADTKVAFSEEFVHTEENASDAYKQILTNLTHNSYSEPIAQQSRAKNETVHRIFFLKALKEGGTVPFNDVEMELHNQLMGVAIGQETEAYLARLRKQAGLDRDKVAELIPPDFEPFVLR